MGQQEFFRDLCEASHDLIQSVSPQGRFLYVNRRWLTTLGYTLSEVEKLRVVDVVHPEDRSRYEHHTEQVLAGRPVEEIEASFLTKDRRRVMVQGSASCRHESGAPVVIRGTFRDVTDSRIAEEELDRLFNLSLDLLCIAGTDGFFKRINPSFERVLGYRRDELLSRSFIEFVHEDDREGTLREVENLAQGRLVVDFENRYRAQDGSYRWLAWRATPLPAAGLIYAVARDVTQDKRNQALLEQQTARLARSNEDLERFAYAASHDLQAPLRSVSDLAEWIGEGLEGREPEKARRHLDLLRSRVDRMRTLVRDLLEYSRADVRPTDSDPVDTAQLVDHVVELLSPPASFSIRARPPMPVLTTAKAPLEQVLRNLIGNAVRHHDREQGEIVVSANRGDGFYEFAVSDDGPGIPEESREEVFEMFNRLTSRDDVEGSGVGLALVQRIVESVGGRVWLETGGGRGATFRFTWPENIDPAREEES